MFEVLSVTTDSLKGMHFLKSFLYKPRKITKRKIIKKAREIPIVLGHGIVVRASFS